MVIYRGAMAIDTRVPGIRFPLHDLPKVSRANGQSVSEPRETVGKCPGAQMPADPAAVLPVIHWRLGRGNAYFELIRCTLNSYNWIPHITLHLFLFSALVEVSPRYFGFQLA
jgi:hypothetical protein